MELTINLLLEPEVSMSRATPVILSAPLLLLQVWNGTGIRYIQPAKWWMNILSWEHTWRVDRYVVNRRCHVLNELNCLECETAEQIIDVTIYCMYIVYIDIQLCHCCCCHCHHHHHYQQQHWLGTPSIDGKIVLKLALEKYAGSVWAGFKWQSE
jgi:hypothetical protein